MGALCRTSILVVQDLPNLAARNFLCLLVLQIPTPLRLPQSLLRAGRHSCSRVLVLVVQREMHFILDLTAFFCRFPFLAVLSRPSHGRFISITED